MYVARGHANDICACANHTIPLVYRCMAKYTQNVLKFFLVCPSQILGPINSGSGSGPCSSPLLLGAQPAPARFYSNRLWGTPNKPGRPVGRPDGNTWKIVLYKAPLMAMHISHPRLLHMHAGIYSEPVKNPTPSPGRLQILLFFGFIIFSRVSIDQSQLTQKYALVRRLTFWNSRVWNLDLFGYNSLRLCQKAKPEGVTDYLGSGGLYHKIFL